MRSICNPLAQGQEADLTSHLSLGEDGEDDAGRHVMVHLEVVAPANAGKHFVGVTAYAVVLNAHDDLSTPHARDETLKRLAPLVVHALWDYSLAHLRSLASGLMDSRLDVPEVTPQPTLLLEQEQARETPPAGLQD